MNHYSAKARLGRLKALHFLREQRHIGARQPRQTVTGAGTGPSAALFGRVQADFNRVAVS